MNKLNVEAEIKAINKRSYLVPMLIVSSLFFIFGFVTWLNGILIPYLKIACQLTDTEAFFVTFAFYISYTIMALPSAWILKKTGLKNGMTTGLWIMALGTLAFIPAALLRTYSIFLTGLFIMGTGLAILQTASNPYVTIMGPQESAAKRISILGICNKVAGAIAPLILAYYILNDGDAFLANLATLNETAKNAALDQLATRVINPYIVLTLILLILGIIIRTSKLPDLEMESEQNGNNKNISAKKNIFSYPHLILGAVALFFYVGVEVIAGDTIIRYGLSLGLEINKAKVFTSYTMAFMITGYILGIILIPKIISQRMVLQISAILGILFALGAIFTADITSVIFVSLFGLANALIWPAIWPLALHNLGKFIKTGSALLIMAIAGGAVLPLLWGILSDTIGAQNAYWMVIPSYLVILFYSVKGYRIKSWM